MLTYIPFIEGNLFSLFIANCVKWLNFSCFSNIFEPIVNYSVGWGLLVGLLETVRDFLRFAAMEWSFYVLFYFDFFVFKVELLLLFSMITSSLIFLYLASPPTSTPTSTTLYTGQNIFKLSIILTYT